MVIFVFKWVKDNTGIVLASFGFMNLHPYTKQGLWFSQRSAKRPHPRGSAVRATPQLTGL